MADIFSEIASIPHFYCIRAAESKLISHYISTFNVPSLDLGCGDGMFGCSLNLEDNHGLDHDASSIEWARRRGVYRTVTLGEASMIPFGDQTFSLVVSNCAIEHMDDLDSVLAEVWRVARTGCQFLFTVPTPRYFDLIDHDRAIASLGMKTPEIISLYNLRHHHVNIFNLQTWVDKLTDVGFRIRKFHHYLPGRIGRFVARMDILYTLNSQQSQDMVVRLEAASRSIRSLIFRTELNAYLSCPWRIDGGTHLLIDAVKI